MNDLKQALTAMGDGILCSPEIAKALGSIEASVFICYMAAQERRPQYAEKGVWLTHAEIHDRTGINRKELDKVKKLLEDKGILTVTKQMWNGNQLINRTYYRINGLRLDDLVRAYAQQSRSTETEVAV